MSQIFSKVGEQIRGHWEREKYKKQMDEAHTRFQVTEDFYPLGQRIKGIIKGKARKFANRYRNRRLYEDDFESEFWKVAWELALEEQYDGGTPFIDKLNNRLESRAISLVRSTKADSRRALHEAVPIDKAQVKVNGQKIPLVEVLAAPGNVEMDVVNSHFLDQMEQDDDLTGQERTMLRLLRQDPDMTLQDLAEDMGLGSRMQASRIKERLFTKLRTKYSKEI